MCRVWLGSHNISETLVDIKVESRMEGSGGAGGVVANSGLNGGAPPPFLSKTYEMVDDPATDAIVSWGAGNNSFVVWNTPEFARDLLPKYFKHNNFSSFVRQLNTYGFRKVDPDRWEFANEGFLRGQKHLLKTISRRRPTHGQVQPQQPQAQNTVAACVEVGKFGLEEEIERLKRDKGVLMKELVMLRQQQQATDHQLQTLGQRLQGMEQRQQQMMSFLAKVMQSPEFLAQFVQQNDSNRRIVGVSKKRRLPKQEDRLGREGANSPDGQIVKYQPLMNEAAKAMLLQILKMDTSPRLDSLSNSGSILVENFHGMDSSSSTRNSGVTLAEVPSSSGVPYLSASSGFSAIASSSAVPEIQSCSGVSDMVTTAELPDMSVLSTIPQSIAAGNGDRSIPEFPSVQGIIPGNVVGMPNEKFVVPEAECAFTDPITDGADGCIPIDGDNFSPDADDIEILMDADQKLPDINDSFWEQFLSVSPLSGETEEVDSSMQEAKEMQSELNNGWGGTQNMAQNMVHLTEQMGLLASERKGNTPPQPKLS